MASFDNKATNLLSSSMQVQIFGHIFTVLPDLFSVHEKYREGRAWDPISHITPYAKVVKGGKGWQVMIIECG